MSDVPDSKAADAKPPEGPWVALGFETFEAMVASQQAEREKLNKQVTDKENMIQTQAGELGTLRSAIKTFETRKPDGDTTAPAAKATKDDPPKGDKFDQMNIVQLQDVLTPDEKQKVDERFKAFEPDARKMISSSDEGKATFLREFLREQDAAPDSFFGKVRTPDVRQDESLSNKIKALFKTNQGTAGAPEITSTGIPGVGKNRSELIEAHLKSVEQSRSSPVIQGGDLLGSLQQLKK
jgi:hypothetical protein